MRKRTSTSSSSETSDVLMSQGVQNIYRSCFGGPNGDRRNDNLSFFFFFFFFLFSSPTLLYPEHLSNRCSLSTSRFTCGASLCLPAWMTNDRGGSIDSFTTRVQQAYDTAISLSRHEHVAIVATRAKALAVPQIRNFQSRQLKCTRRYAQLL